MANITDIFSTLNDTVIQLLKPSADTVVQMNWPGFALSPSDFKMHGDENAPYNAQVAEETTSQIADIIPANQINFEDSGYEVHNVYEAMVFGAMPKSSGGQAEANPAGKLLLDAQFNFVRSEKGSIQDPQEFYYPVKATPVDWYAETNPNWTQFNLNQSQVPPAKQGSPFLTSGGQKLIDKGVFKLVTAGATSAQLYTQLQNAVSKVAVSQKAMAATPLEAAAEALSPAAAAALKPIALQLNANSIRTEVLAKVGNLADDAKLKSTLSTLSATPAFKNAITTAPALTSARLPSAIQIDASKLAVLPAAKLSVVQRVNVNQILAKNSSSAPIQAATTNIRISFKYCLVRLRRDWYNSTVLSLPNWYFPGLKAGFFSAGAQGSAPPQFPLLPQAFLAIRDLTISAQWSDQDRKNLANVVSFGPFDLRSKAITQNEVRVSGLQILSWLSKRNQMLAPLSDPSV